MSFLAKSEALGERSLSSKLTTVDESESVLLVSVLADSCSALEEEVASSSISLSISSSSGSEASESSRVLVGRESKLLAIVYIHSWLHVQLHTWLIIVIHMTGSVSESVDVMNLIMIDI